ncbi:hypothetical protein [[Pseudomonas] boreopolis]|uniref:hypothetical protein n=1 Tax=Xanthomonas boreopolis TaxID=86183 RepID=UPI003D9BA0AC
MADTIELLEMIGRDASLRRASPQALATALERVDAPRALTAAAASGETACLGQFDGIDLFPPQVTQAIAAPLFAVQL